MNDNIETKLQELVTAVTGKEELRLHTDFVEGAWVADTGGVIVGGSTKEEALRNLMTIWTETAVSRRDDLDKEFLELVAKLYAIGDHIDAIEKALRGGRPNCDICDDTYVVINSMGDQRECDYCDHSYDDYLDSPLRSP